MCGRDGSARSSREGADLEGSKAFPSCGSCEEAFEPLVFRQRLAWGPDDGEVEQDMQSVSDAV